jgi:hypothetical protein
LQERNKKMGKKYVFERKKEEELSLKRRICVDAKKIKIRRLGEFLYQ